MIKSMLLLTTALLALAPAMSASAVAADDTTVKITHNDHPEHPGPRLSADQADSDGSVDTGGQHVDYHAVAGTLVVHPKGWDDAEKPGTPGDQAADQNPTAEASMFYVAYFRKGTRPENRPITFLYNGGPGSSSVWLHMGAFGPRRVLTLDHDHTPGAPYQLVNNDESLLDASDLVFVDAPGTGFSRIAGKDKEKAFYGIDQDAQAFASFVTQFMSKYGRWNSPKFLFGESYGTTRSAVLANELEQEDSVDLNGVMLLSQVLNFDAGPDQPGVNPGIDLPYLAALPTYAATAWYHHKLPGTPPADLHALLAEVETYATGEYASALLLGSMLKPDRLQAVSEKLHEYTGLPVDYLVKARLRVDGGMFEKTLLGQNDATTGRFDTRFSGPSIDPLAKEADYDPQSSAISSAYVSAFNDYVRRQLGYGAERAYKPEIEIDNWDNRHVQPNTTQPDTGTPNVLPDLASAMITNPTLKVQLNQGYFDLATPYYEGVLEMSHLPMPVALQANIEYRRYESGHMVYAHPDSLKQLHDNAADFIRRNSGGRPAGAHPADAQQTGR